MCLASVHVQGGTVTPSSIGTEAHLKALVDTASDGIVSADTTGTIIQFNRAAERIF